MLRAHSTNDKPSSTMIRSSWIVVSSGGCTYLDLNVTDLDVNSSEPLLVVDWLPDSALVVIARYLVVWLVAHCSGKELFILGFKAGQSKYEMVLLQTKMRDLTWQWATVKLAKVVRCSESFASMIWK